MHLVCLNHVPNLIRRWCLQIDRVSIRSIDEKLENTRFPHNIRVMYYESIANANQWKARANRVFVLHIGVPIMAKEIPIIFLSHFFIYSMAIKILHAPDSDDEINLAESLINFYCRTAPMIHGSSIELFSLHAHLHLPEQVRRHGGLCHSSAFAFESCIRYIERKAHGSKQLASQIAYWIELESMTTNEKIKICEPTVASVC